MCIAWHWHIVTKCGNAPSWYVKNTICRQEGNSRALSQDSVIPSFVYMQGIYAGVPHSDA